MQIAFTQKNSKKILPWLLLFFLLSFFFYYLAKNINQKINQSQSTSENKATACDQTPPGKYINYLFENRKNFKFEYKIDENKKEIVWKISGPEKDLKLLKTHIEQMGCLLKQGFTPRKWDPIFVAEQKTKKYVKTNVSFLNKTTIKVEKKAENNCSFEVIKAHAAAVKGFFTIGREEARKTHPIDKILPICEKEGVEI